MRLFFDTETTGLPLWKMPSTHEGQPHLVQLGAVLVDPEGREVSVLNLLVNPGVSIPEETSAIHGITTERAVAGGVSERMALALFFKMAEMAGEIVAHNLGFDQRIIRILALREGKLELYQRAFDRPTYCTMRAATPVCCLRGTRGYKWPKLTEAYEMLVDPAGFEGAHDALVDVRACMKVYEALRAV